jgi:hypothetical protein
MHVTRDAFINRSDTVISTTAMGESEIGLKPTRMQADRWEQETPGNKQSPLMKSEV